MNKLFENAKFGDLYRSKDGTLNIFCKRFHETDIVLIRQTDDAIGYFSIRVNEFGQEHIDKETWGNSCGDIIEKVR